MLVIHLQRRVVDPEAVVQELLELAPAAVAVVPRPHQHMRGQRREAGGDLPDVQVVDLDDAGRTRESAADVLGTDPLRGAL